MSLLKGGDRFVASLGASLTLAYRTLPPSEAPLNRGQWNINAKVRWAETGACEALAYTETISHIHAGVSDGRRWRTPIDPARHAPQSTIGGQDGFCIKDL